MPKLNISAEMLQAPSFGEGVGLSTICISGGSWQMSDVDVMPFSRSFSLHFRLESILTP